jgi:hypothetical protein
MRTCVIELSEEQFVELVGLLGGAMGAAVEAGDSREALSAMRLMNAVNRDNPSWIPYEVDKYEKEIEQREAMMPLLPGMVQ